MKLIKGQQQITDQKQINELAHKIFGKRIEILDLRNGKFFTGKVVSVGLNSFRFLDDTATQTKGYNYNDVEIKI